MKSGQPEVLTTWNTFYASTYWNMRLSVAGALMDEHAQSNILLRDRTRNLAVVGRQPHPNPTRPTCLLGSLVVGSRRPPSVWFEAPLSPLPFEGALATCVFLCSF